MIAPVRPGRGADRPRGGAPRPQARPRCEMRDRRQPPPGRERAPRTTTRSRGSSTTGSRRACACSWTPRSTTPWALATLQLSAEQLATDSPYNTYRARGCRPARSTRPGDAALEAALNPADGRLALLRHHGPEDADHRVRHVVRRVPRAQAEVPGECRLSDGAACAARPCSVTRSRTRSRRCCTGRPTRELGLAWELRPRRRHAGAACAAFLDGARRLAGSGCR